MNMTLALVSLLLTSAGTTLVERSPSDAASQSAAAEVAPSAGTVSKTSGAVSYDSAQGQRVVEALPGILAGELSTLDRRRLGTKVLSKSRVSIERGRFSKGGTMVVFVNVNLRAKDPEADPKFISGVLTVTDDGALASVLVPPKMSTARFDFEALSDGDGDGVDEVTYVATDPSGAQRRRVRVGDDGPKTTVLSAPDAG